MVLVVRSFLSWKKKLSVNEVGLAVYNLLPQSAIISSSVTRALLTVFTHATGLSYLSGNCGINGERMRRSVARFLPMTAAEVAAVGAPPSRTLRRHSEGDRPFVASSLGWRCFSVSLPTAWLAWWHPTLFRLASFTGPPDLFLFVLMCWWLVRVIPVSR